MSFTVTGGTPGTRVLQDGRWWVVLACGCCMEPVAGPWTPMPNTPCKRAGAGS